MFLFCVESSHSKGLGHLFRTINLVQLLREKGYQSVIALLGGDGASKDWLKRTGLPFSVVSQESDSDWESDLIYRYSPNVWINDRLGTDAYHAGLIKKAGLHLVTFDDWGTGAALADLHVAALAKVRGESPLGKQVLIGPEYLVFPPEVIQLRRARFENKRWLVTLGGSDTYGATLSVVDWLINRSMAATIVLGPSFAHNSEISLFDTELLTIKRSVPSLLRELADHDFAITGGGLTAFEAAVLGVPAATIANEPWEVAHAMYLQSLGCSIYAGNYEQINLDILDVDLDFEGMSNAALNAFQPYGSNIVVESIINIAKPQIV